MSNVRNRLLISLVMITQPLLWMILPARVSILNLAHVVMICLTINIHKIPADTVLPLHRREYRGPLDHGGTGDCRDLREIPDCRVKLARWGAGGNKVLVVTRANADHQDLRGLPVLREHKALPALWDQWAILGAAGLWDLQDLLRILFLLLLQIRYVNHLKKTYSLSNLKFLT